MARVAGDSAVGGDGGNVAGVGADVFFRGLRSFGVSADGRDGLRSAHDSIPTFRVRGFNECPRERAFVVEQLVYGNR